MAGVVAVGFLLLVQFTARAASDRPSPDALRGFRITHWALDEGAPSRINSITQSVDGMLWIGGVDGLYRFDGVTFEKVEGKRRLVVAQVLAARDGAVWVGLARGQGMLVYDKGELRPSGMPNPSREVNDIAEDRDGAIWVARGGRSVRSLARFFGGRWQEFDAESGLPEQPVWNLLVARDGTLWVVLEHAIYRRRPGAERFEPTGLVVPPRSSLAEDPQGGIWLSDRLGTRRVAASGSGAIVPGPLHHHPEPAGGTRTLFDRHGDLWEATWSDGVVRVSDPLGDQRRIRVARLDMTLGLLSDQTRAIFRDREGNVWVGTELGLNMLRRVPITAPPVIPVNSSSSYRLALATDGTVYAAEATGVYRIAPGADPVLALRTDSPVDALCRSASSGVWVVTGSRVVRLARGRTAVFNKPAPFTAQACAEDATGRLWLPALDKGLFVLASGRWSEWPGLGPGVGVPGNVGILPDGRPVIHFRNGIPAGPAPFVGIDERSAPSDGIEGMLLGQGGVLVSGAAGLSAPFMPGRPLLDKARYPWAASLNGLAEGPGGYTWAVGDEGVVRLRTRDLAGALAHPGAPVPSRLFDFRDGLNSFVQKGGGDQIVVGGDGRVWFATRRNMLSIDPATISVNRTPPSVLVRTVQAGVRTFGAADGLHLPAGTTRVEIAFTAPSLSVPQRVAFRYRLIGAEHAWTTVRNIRRAVFSDLGPGRYTFEVLAANEDGAWSTTPARLSFTIARAFHQTWLFRVTAALALLGLLYAGFSLRLRQVSGQIQQRLLARTRERERIARELHDTMIQGVQGLIMRFQSVADRFADDPRAQAVLIPALDRAEEMLVEGRERVSGLRRADARDFVREVKRLMADEIYPAGLIGPIVIRGRPRRLLPELVDEVLAVICEALNNAACHSGATRVDVGVIFGSLKFTVFVRDNGVGISPDFASPRGRPGHYGLLGMYERARAMKGKLRIESAEGFGTEIRLKVPARFAYLPDGMSAR